MSGYTRPKRQPSVQSGHALAAERWWFWLFGAFVLVVLGAGWLLVPLGESRICKENFDKIQYGWTEEEVKSLLGEPLMDMGDDAIWTTSESWDGILEEGGIGIIFSKTQGVTEKAFLSSKISFYERMKRRIERRIRALWP